MCALCQLGRRFFNAVRRTLVVTYVVNRYFVYRLWEE